MTTEQLTQEIMRIKEHQAKADAEHERFETVIKEIQEDVKTTKNLAEDVHIMAINIERMQKTIEDTNKKVDALTSKEFIEYKENKKLVKQNIIGKVTTSVVTTIFGIITFLVGLYISKGG